MKKKLIILPVLLVMAALIINPARYIRSISEGLMIFAISVLPALFPFFFFTKLLTALGVADNVSSIMRKPVYALYNAPGEGGYVLLMSVLSGYPVGAKLIADFYEMNAISKREAQRIAAFTSSSGPLFILGTLGVSVLGSYNAGLIILASHYAATLLNGLLYRGKRKDAIRPVAALPRIGYDKALSESVYGAIASILTVGSFIALFNLIGDILSDIKILMIIENAAGLLLKLLGLPETLSKGIGFGIIEMTRGCIYLAESGAPYKAVVPLAAASVTFGGLGIALQSLTYLSKCGIKPLFYITIKLSQTAIAFSLCILLCLIFPI